MNRYVAYYRVSTKKQGESGLGLEAQRRTVEQFCLSGQILAEYTDIESGKNNNRPELLKAIVYAKQHGALLVIAKLDRLSRNVFFISSLMESKVRFKACDLPEADHFTVHLFAALAEKERKMISERTKAALAAKAARGEVIIRKSNLSEEARQKASQTIATNARKDESVQRAAALIVMYREKGMSYAKIAQKLNQSTYKTRTGKPFHAMQVQRIYQRGASN
jgi:DNA invertase Pin-like site-specific DNA recombinase